MLSRWSREELNITNLLSDIRWECLLTGAIISASRDIGLRLTKLESEEKVISLAFRASWGIARVNVQIPTYAFISEPESLTPLEITIHLKLRDSSARRDVLEKINRMLKLPATLLTPDKLTPLEGGITASYLIEPSSILLSPGGELDLYKLSKYILRILKSILESYY